MANQIDFIVRQGLQATTNVVVGTYAMTNAAPLYGMIVSGNVGIGTAAPTSQLEVRGNIQLTNTATTISGIRFADGTYQTTSASSYSTPPGGNTDSVQYNAGGSFGGSSGFVFHTGNTHVGIGTSKADYALSVHAVDGPALFATQNGTDYQIFVGDNVPTGNAAVLGFSEAGQYAYLSTGNNQPTPIITATQAGRVGIGNSAPLNRLDVAGGMAVGATYAGSVTAPTNGMALQGNLVIGSVSTGARLGVVPAASQNALQLSAVSSNYFYIQAIDAAAQNKFLLNASGNITVGGWQGNVIAANYGGTGLTTYSAGDILYATSSTTTLSRLGMTAANNGNVLLSNGTAPYWGNISLNSSALSGVLPVSKGGTNVTSFSGSAVVATAADGLSMTSVTSATNAAVVFSNAGVPTAVSGGPYTYLTTGAGGGNLSFGKVDLVNGITGTLTIANGGSGVSSLPQYSLLYGSSNTISMGTLLTSSVSALVTGVTGAPQWVSGASANTVLRSNGTSITFAQVALTTDVTGVLPYANGGTNTNTSFTQGSVIFAGASGFAQDNANLYWDDTNNRLGLGTTAPTTTLDVNGAATIRNGANVVAGGLFVQAGTGNFVGGIVANDVNANVSIYTPRLSVGTSANVNGLTSNTSIIVSGTQDAFNTSTGALTVAGGVGIAKTLWVGNAAFVQGNLTVGGNLIVSGNVTYINSNITTIDDPVITIGTGPNGSNLTTADTMDRGLEFHYYSGGADRYGFVGWQNSTGKFTYIANATGNTTSQIYTGAFGDAQFGNITIGGGINTPIPSTSTTTGALVISGTGGIGIGGSLHVGQYAYVTQGFNTGGTATVNALVSNTGISATTLSASGQITGGSLVSNSFVQGASIYSSGPISAVGAITGASLTSNGFIFGSSINTSGAAIFNSVTSNTFVNGASLYSSGPISAVGRITGSSLVSNSTTQTVNFYASGDINGAGTATFANISSNGYVNGASIYSSGTINAAGNGIFNNVVSNGYVNGSNLTITGPAQITGNLLVGGNLTISGNVISGNVTVFQGNSGVFYGDGNGFGALYAGITGYTALPSTVLQTAADVNSYAQNNFENTNNGNQASTDWVATAANGTDTTNYIDMGITSGTWDGTQSNSLGTSLRANDGYLYVQGGTGGGNLVVGTSSPGTALKINVGGTGSGYISAVFNQAGNASISTTTGALVLTGGLGLSGNINAGGTITGTRITGTSVNAGAIGNITPGTGQFTTLITQNTATVNALVSNSFINGTSLYSSGPISAVGTITGASLVSNGSISGTSLYASGTINTGGNASFANVISNGYVQGTSLYSSGPISAVGSITGANLYSNAAIVGSTIQGSTSMLTGTFVANTSVATATLTASGAATVNSLVSNTTVRGNAFIMNGNVSSTSTTGALTLDSFATASFRTAHYLVQVTDNTNSQYHSTQIMLIHNGTTVFQSEYNIIYSNAVLGTFDSTIAAGTVQLQFTPSAATNKTIKVLRTAIDV